MFLNGKCGKISVEHDSAGVPYITAEDKDDALFGLGFCHARDRGLQMLLVRTAGRGQLSRHLVASDEFFELDLFFRRLNFTSDLDSERAALSARARSGTAAYCGGVNAWFDRSGIPWELRLFGYQIDGDLWSEADVFLTAKAIGYVNLAQSQAEVERFIIECVQAGVSRDKLEELFPGQLNGLDEELVRKVRLQRRVVPEGIKWALPLPRALASNNWVISGARSASGKPILSNDPHLEVNRLPAVWYESVLRWRSEGKWRYAMGATLPGVPAVIIGRTPDLAWGVTYAFGDCVDSWIEECRDGMYRRGDAWRPFTVRKEVIHRKQTAVDVCFFESEHGVLEGNPHQAGYHLASRWSCGEGTSAITLDAGLGVLDARTVAEGRGLLGRVNNCTWNWVLADRYGNTGYQMSGKVPLRREDVSGLVPARGWDPRNDWQGFAAVEELPRTLNPEDGLIVTANHDLNHLGRVRPINLPMGPYRAERILAWLRDRNGLTVEDMKRLQHDLYSIQAEQFMALLRPILAEPEFLSHSTAHILGEWDLCYTADSKGAFVFEQFYRALIGEIFGGEEDGAFGREVIRHLLDDSPIFTGFYHAFDRVMLAERSAWFGHRSRTEIFRRALERALRVPPEPYGADRRFVMKHLLFGGRLPKWLGFDRGPFVLVGSRATVSQGQMYRSLGRQTTFAPSLRVVTDLATDRMDTMLAGGPSDRRFSRWYGRGIRDWLYGRFKTLRGSDS